jgi:hypothetical protein
VVEILRWRKLALTPGRGSATTISFGTKFVAVPDSASNAAET